MLSTYLHIAALVPKMAVSFSRNRMSCEPKLSSKGFNNLQFEETSLISLFSGESFMSVVDCSKFLVQQKNVFTFDFDQVTLCSVKC